MAPRRMPSCGRLRSSCASHSQFHDLRVIAARMKLYTFLQVLVVQHLTLSLSLALLWYAGSTLNYAQGYSQNDHVAVESEDVAASKYQFTHLKGKTEDGARRVSRNRTTANAECCTCTMPPFTVPDDQEVLAANFDANRYHKCYEEVDDDDNTQEGKKRGDRTDGMAVSSNDFAKAANVSTANSRDVHDQDNACSDPACTDQALFPSETSERGRCLPPGTAGMQKSPSFGCAVPFGDGTDTEAGADAAAETRTSDFGVHRGQGMDSTCSVWGGTYEERRNAFLHRYSQVYNSDIETVQARELHRFKGQVYLDFAGSGVYLESQLRHVYEDLTHNAYSNIHSRSPSSKMSEMKLNEARRTVKSFFDAPDDEYTVIFTSGATGALKLVGESFNFMKGVSSFYYLRINHNSVLGIREYAYTKGVKSVKALAERDVERLLREREQATMNGGHDSSSNPLDGTTQNRPSCLFAFPAKDNWNGKFFPLSWIHRVKKNGLSSDGCKWYVLLDAAAHAATTPLSLSKHPADFVVVSFYKIFGYPTGIGALIARTEDACTLNRIYWGGGSVAASVCDTRWQKRKGEFSLRFEDGTHSFLAIVGSIHGIRMIQTIGLERIHRHVAALTEHFYERLLLLKHSNGARGVVVHWNEPSPPSGGIVTFNILHPDGSFVPFTQVETAASKAGFHLRTGCFCNPGGCQDYLGLTAEDIVRRSDNRQSCSDPLPVDPNKGVLSAKNLSTTRAREYHQFSRRPLGSVRVSLGYLSTFADVDKFVLFVKQMWVK